MIVSRLKNRLIQGGPKSLAVRLAFRTQAALHGVRMRVTGDRVSLVKGDREVVLGGRDFIAIPLVVHGWDGFFASLEGEVREGRTVLDFSVPGLHRYKNGLEFYFPSLAEDDCMDAYTASYRPAKGDVVWDVGAHAGMTTYFLSQMVGAAGKVYAFEPDETNYAYLLRNIELHGLKNVTVVKAALSGETGTATFCMDGTMSAGLSETLSYTAAEHTKVVATLSFEDACRQFGEVPKYVKMDIEGAELAVVESSVAFLKTHPIHFSIESNHLVGGRLTSGPLDVLFGGAGYRAWSSMEYGQMFSWAEPSVAA